VKASNSSSTALDDQLGVELGELPGALGLTGGHPQGQQLVDPLLSPDGGAVCLTV
jgi:uncharacterized membrane protein